MLTVPPQPPAYEMEEANDDDSEVVYPLHCTSEETKHKRHTLAIITQQEDGRARIQTWATSASLSIQSF